MSGPPPIRSVMTTAVTAPQAAISPAPGPKTTPEKTKDRAAAVRLALRLYFREMARRKVLTGAAVLLPAVGNIFQSYLTPLIVADLVGRMAAGEVLTPALVTPYVVWFFAALVAGHACWRVGIHCLNRVDVGGIERLYIDGMDALLAKDTAFFHENFAGSLTKRVLSFASRFEDFVDIFAFQIVGQLLPLGFAAVVLWRYDPRLVAVLLGMVVVTAGVLAPLI